MTTCYCFAYGSNMDLGRILKRVGPVTVRIPAVVRHWRLTFSKIAKDIPGVGYANIMPSPGDVVEGIVYILNPEQIRKLDCYEGVSCRSYERCTIDVMRSDTGELIPAFVYIACAEKVGEGLKPTKEYLNHLLAGRDFLGEHYIQRLKASETID